MNETNPIYDKASIIKAWQQANDRLVALVQPLDSSLWAKQEGEKWSIAGQVEHLFLSANPVSSALKFPKGMLEAKFGRYEGEQPEYDALYQRYCRELAEIKGKFVNPIPPSAEAKSSAEILESWAMIRAKIPQRLENWTEEELDQYILPHPLLGKLSVRGMLFFTIMHTDHHFRSIESIVQSTV